jgi:hypothetical protein
MRCPKSLKFLRYLKSPKSLQIRSFLRCLKNQKCSR